ncbi:MAG: hypothetical protein K0S80_4326 [Neobacillus sp.]|nr:hypothetical protein [Neobacillus sp.]
MHGSSLYSLAFNSSSIHSLAFLCYFIERKLNEFYMKRLSSSEITNLWTHYIRETLAICISKYALKCAKDTDIISTFEFALNLFDLASAVYLK